MAEIAPTSTELDDQQSLADMVRWMNAQKRKPGAKQAKWRHETARKQLEMLGLRFLQPSGERGKLYFRLRDLKDVAPILFNAYTRNDD